MRKGLTTKVIKLCAIIEVHSSTSVSLSSTCIQMRMFSRTSDTCHSHTKTTISTTCYTRTKKYDLRRNNIMMVGLGPDAHTRSHIHRKDVDRF